MAFAILYIDGEFIVAISNYDHFMYLNNLKTLTFFDRVCYNELVLY